ncbi:MAG: glycosyltransferase [Spirochaetales bacterium]|nr:glycosyltransferase [Spirochaetales bacterium]
MTGTAAIHYSVIILVWNKEKELDLILASLENQLNDEFCFEVIIIDDGSERPLDDLVGKYRSSFPLKYLRQEHSGIRGALRNLGAERAEGDRLIFLDGDMLAGPGVFREFHSVVKDDKKKVALGVRTETFENKNENIDAFTVKNDFGKIEQLFGQDEERLAALPWYQGGKEPSWKWNLFYSHSFCIWKETYLSVGGFDPAFSKHWGAEDIELGYRLASAGCSIILADKARLYHLHHPADILGKEAELKINYNLFFSKHRKWDAEIFIKEVEVDAEYKERMATLIRNRICIIGSVKPDIAEQIPDNTVLFGIEDPALLSSGKISAAFVPEPETDFSFIEPIIGMTSGYEERCFSMALVSGKYRSNNTGLFRHIIREAARITEKVMVLDKEDGTDLQSINVNLIAPSYNYLFFQTANSNQGCYDYYIRNLAFAAQQAGLKTAIHFPMYANKSSAGPYLAADENEKKKLAGLYNHTLDNLFEEIPAMLDPVYCEFSRYPVKYRLHWKDFPSGTDPETAAGSLRGKYSIIIPVSSGQQGLGSACIETAVLKPGTDSVQAGLDRKNHKKDKDKFVFFWSEQYADSYSNLDTVLSVFAGLFGGNDRVLLNISSAYHEQQYNTAFFNSAYLSFINGRMSETNCLNDALLNSLKEKYGETRNIRFSSTGLGRSDLMNSLSGCDCYISVSSHTLVNPLVIESVARGRKPLITLNDSYGDYFEGNEYLAVDSQAGKPLRDSLAKAMLQAVRDRDSLYLDENRAAQFAEENDWLVRGKLLKDIIYRYFR